MTCVMKNLFYMAMLALAMTTFFSCEEDKKSAELLKKSTEIAKQRTDSFRIVQKDSIEKAMARERRRGDSLRRADSLRRVYERNNIKISGKIGDSHATLSIRSNGGSNASGTLTCDGRSYRVSGSFGDHVKMNGSQKIDSVSSVKVSINLTRVEEDQFSGQVTIDDRGRLSTRRTIMYRY